MDQTVKTCRKCGMRKSTALFYAEKRNNDGLRSWCKNCMDMKSNEWAQANKDKLAIIRKRTVTRHPEYYSKYRLQHRLYVRRYNHKVRSTIQGQLDSRMSRAIRLALQGTKAGRNWETLVNYTVYDLKQHLESKFLPGMSWENMDKWHVDHIIPISFFEFTKPEDQEFQYCWSLDNLQPLWAKDNLAKNDKVQLCVK